MNARNLERVVDLPVHRMGQDLLTRNAAANELDGALDPYLMISFYEMKGPTFPPHPHAGFAVATYILPESASGFINQDSLGNLNAIAPGALHVTVAGRGVLHEEEPKHEGTLAQGFQIWMDLPNSSRQIEPHALHLFADDVPVWRADGLSARVVLGNMHNIHSPLLTPIPLRLLDIDMKPSTRLELLLRDGETAALFMLGGEIQVGDQVAREGQLGVTSREGSILRIDAGEAGARLTLFGGMPLNQARVQRGPFVAGDAAELVGFMRAYEAGRFGSLRAFADQR